MTTLKSNGQGAYQIIDDQNEFLIRLSCDDPENVVFKRKVAGYKAFMIGIVKGVLYNLGAEGPIRCQLDITSNDSAAYPKLMILLNYMEKRKPKN